MNPVWLAMCVLVAGGIVACVEVPYLIKKRMIKEFCVFAVLLAIGVTAGLSIALRVHLPNPLDWIAYVCKPVGDFVREKLT